MQVAYNKETGQVVGLVNGEWKPMTAAKGPKGEVVFLNPDSNQWEPIGSQTPQEEQGFSFVSDVLKPLLQLKVNGKIANDRMMRGMLKGATWLPNLAASATTGFDSNINIGDKIADAGGLAKQDPNQQILNGVAEGLGATVGSAGLGPLMKLWGNAPKAWNAAANFFGANPMQNLIGSTAGGGVGGAVEAITDDPLAGTVANIATALGSGSLMKGGKAVADRFWKSQIDPEKVKSFEDAWMQPYLLSNVSKPGLMMSLDAMLSKAPGGAGRMMDAKKAAQEGYLSLFNNTLDDLAGGAPIPKSKEAMGRILSNERLEGMRNDFRNWSGTEVADIFRSGDNPIYKRRVPLNETKAYIVDKIADFDPAQREMKFKELVRPIKNILTPVPGSPVQINPIYLTVKDVRNNQLNSAIKGASKDPQNGLSSVGKNAFTNLSKAVKRDMNNVLTKEEQPIVNAWDKAYSTQNDSLGDAANIFFQGDDAARGAAFMNADSAQLKNLAANMDDPSAMGQLAAGTLWQKSLGNGGPSSVRTASTLQEGRTSLAPEVQDFLFGDKTKNLFDISKAMNDANVLSNTSNTGAINAMLKAFSSATGLLTAGLLPRYVSGKFTNPEYIAQVAGRAINPEPTNWLNLSRYLLQPIGEK